MLRSTIAACVRATALLLLAHCAPAVRADAPPRKEAVSSLIPASPTTRPKAAAQRTAPDPDLRRPATSSLIPPPARPREAVSSLIPAQPPGSQPVLPEPAPPVITIQPRSSAAAPALPAPPPAPMPARPAVPLRDTAAKIGESHPEVPSPKAVVASPAKSNDAKPEQKPAVVAVPNPQSSPAPASPTPPVSKPSPPSPNSVDVAPAKIKDAKPEPKPAVVAIPKPPPLPVNEAPAASKPATIPKVEAPAPKVAVRETSPDPAPRPRAQPLPSAKVEPSNSKPAVPPKAGDAAKIASSPAEISKAPSPKIASKPPEKPKDTKPESKPAVVATPKTESMPAPISPIPPTSKPTEAPKITVRETTPVLVPKPPEQPLTQAKVEPRNTKPASAVKIAGIPDGVAPLSPPKSAGVTPEQDPLAKPDANLKPAVVAVPETASPSKPPSHANKPTEVSKFEHPAPRSTARETPPVPAPKPPAQPKSFAKAELAFTDPLSEPMPAIPSKPARETAAILDPIPQPSSQNPKISAAAKSSPQPAPEVPKVEVPVMKIAMLETPPRLAPEPPRLRATQPLRHPELVEEDPPSLPKEPAVSRQIAPPEPPNAARPFALATVEAALGDASLAAEVAKVLSKEPVKLPDFLEAPRPKAIRTPSERWLIMACEKLNALPEEERVVEFQKILARYRQMRSEERRLARPR